MAEQTSANAYFNKAVTLQVQRQFEEALAAYEQVIHLDPAFVEAHYNKGGVLRDQGRLEEAPAAYEQVIHLDPSFAFAFAYANKGRMLQKLGRLEEALVAHEQSIRLDPNEAAFHKDKAWALEGPGRREEAEQSYLKALKLPDPDGKCR